MATADPGIQGYKQITSCHVIYLDNGLKTRS